MRQANIRNFCIVAHIDHGKSTLADRLIELTGTLDKRLMREQVLDTMDLERERGITIKLNAVRMSYHAKDGQLYELNLIDTPGHVDFTYEVSRSLVACEGAILVVDASQGVQAQTLSNLFLAMDAGLEILPVLNKIDLPGAEPERRAQEIMDLIGARREEILAVSAKEGTGVPELLEAIIARVPSPRGREEAPLRALIFDSYYDRYRGAIPSIRVVDGTVRKGMEIAFGSHPDDVYHADEVGYLQLGQHPAHELEAGEVGYLVASLRNVRDARVGDTILDAHDPATARLHGYRGVKSRIMAPSEYIGGIMKLGQERRGVYLGMHYLDTARVEFQFEFPLGEIVLDFYDKLKSLSRGYASLDYEMAGYRESDLVKLDMLINGDPIDAFSVIIHRDKAYEYGRKIAEKLKELIPRQLYQVAIQAAIGNKIIARETISAFRKDVLAKCYGGDVTRKRKLLEKQKEGKKRMKQIGAVEIPQEAFLAEIGRAHV